MKGRIVVLGRVQERPAAALIEDGQVEDLLLPPRDEDRPMPGTIFRAVADRPVKGMGGMFLKLPGRGRAFLRQAKGVRPGAPVLVQSTGHAEQGKALPVTSRLLFKGRFAIVTPDAPGLNISRRIRDEARRAGVTALAEAGMRGDEAGLILRSASEGAIDDDIARDIAGLRDLARQVCHEAGRADPAKLLDGPDAHALARREWLAPGTQLVEEDGFAGHGIDDAIREVRGPYVSLPGSAFVMVEPTSALVAVDVNTGGDTSPAAGLKTNLAVARALPRALRCRGLGGQIVIDPAPMSKAHRRALEQELKKDFRADPVETAFVGWTPLGHIEMQRKRERLPLSEALLP